MERAPTQHRPPFERHFSLWSHQDESLMKPSSTTIKDLEQSCKLAERYPFTTAIFVQTSLNDKDGKEKIFGSRKSQETAQQLKGCQISERIRLQLGKTQFQPYKDTHLERREGKPKARFLESGVYPIRDFRKENFPIFSPPYRAMWNYSRTISRKMRRSS